MPMRKNYDKSAVARLFEAQGGLATRAQLIDLGVPASTIRHRERPQGSWRRVLRGVCASHGRALTGMGGLRAALMYAGPDSVVTGFAALRAHEVAVAGTAGVVGAVGERVKVLIPHGRRRSSGGFVLVARTTRMPEPVHIGGCQVAPVARAAVDACLDTKDTELVREIVTELVYSGRCSPAVLRAELEAHQTQRSARLRAVLAEFTAGIRNSAEAQCRLRLMRSAVPRPVWNRRVVEQSTGRGAVLPGAFWPDRGVALEVRPPGDALSPAAADRAAARRRWMAGVLRLTVAQVTPGQLREGWEEVWTELRRLLNRPPTYRLPLGYVLG